MRGRQIPVHNSLNSLFICFGEEWGPQGPGPRYANTILPLNPRAAGEGDPRRDAGLFKGWRELCHLKINEGDREKIRLVEEKIVL